MNKIILKPGNGINYPTKGDYIDVNMNIFDESGVLIFSNKDERMTLRFKSDGMVIDELEELIGEMSLYEKCSIQIKKQLFSDLEGKEIMRTLVYEIEIVHIGINP